jgi:DNA-binding IclR family transcriptional regulator
MPTPKFSPPLGENATRVLRLIKADPDMKVRDIANALGLSTQRVYQIIDTLERRGELKEVI